MTYAEVKTMLASSGLPVAYRAFESITNPPFIIWMSDADNNFAADGKVFFSAHQIRIELYTTKVDVESETALENALSEHFYTKERIYIDEEKMYETIYELEV